MFIPLKRFYSKIRGLINFSSLKKEKIMSVGSVLEKQAARYSKKPLILFEGRTITYKDFNESANQYANFFKNKGFVKGDTVALLMDNRPEFLIVHAGLAKIGVVPALINNNIKGRILAHALNIAEARAIIIGHEFMKEYTDIAKEVKLHAPGDIFVECEGKSLVIPKGLQDMDSILKKQSTNNPEMVPPISSKDILEYIYTSGTTGMPKATVLKHQRWLQLGYIVGGYCLRIVSNDVQYLCLPLYHNSGINLAWSTTLIQGCTLAMRRKFSASAFWDDIRKYNATIMIYIGELCRYLNNQPKKDNDADNSLKYILGNGMRMDYWTEFQKRFGIKRIIEVYGATEGVGGLTNLKGVPGMIGQLTAAGIRMGEVARYNPDTGDFIKNDQGFMEKCKIGESGMFLAAISSTNPFAGYKSNKKATSDKIISDVFKKGDNYFISGDLFKLHKKDYVSFVDRLGDTFKWKGEVVATNEVADILNHFGGIEDCNVYGISINNTEGRCGMVALTLIKGTAIDWESFAKYIVDNLATYARPYFVRIRSEKDATSSFKQLKTGLQNDGFNSAIVKDPLYFLDPRTWQFVEITKKLYDEIQDGKIKF